MKAHRKNKQISFNKGDYILLLNIFEDNPEYHVKTELESFYKWLGELNWIIEVSPYKIDYIKNNIIVAEKPSPEGTVDNFIYTKTIRTISKEKYENLLKNQQPKYKIGDKINNPYKRIPNQTIRELNEIFKKGENISISAYREDRAKAKSIPYLTISSINTVLLYNIKYDKPLNKLVHRYLFEETIVGGKLTLFGHIEEEAVEIFKPVNEHWAELNQ